jgi:putative DNA methylase
MTKQKRKLIEVALPLEAINRESAREKTIRHGHPATLHLWWARRPLASARAMIFSQLVDDPSSNPEEFPTLEAQEVERQRLFRMIEELVTWENISNKDLLARAYKEILKSTDGNPPPLLDPFAGGGAIPLEAQRLGLEARASDLNPIALTINRALIGIPPLWSGVKPVFGGSVDEKLEWPGMAGLSEDLKQYGTWMRDEAKKKIGQFYPTAQIPDGSTALVIAWIWARTVVCPNPACGIQMPLVKTWWLSKKKGRETYIEPFVDVTPNGDKVVKYKIEIGTKNSPTKEDDGTISRNGAICIGCGTSAPLTHVRDEGVAGRIHHQLMALAAQGKGQRHYLESDVINWDDQAIVLPDDLPETELSTHPQYMGPPRYGLTKHTDLFTKRQLLALTTFSDLIPVVKEKIRLDAIEAGMHDDGIGLESGGKGATAYAESLCVYLAFIIDKLADLGNSLCPWEPVAECPRNLFARQAIPMAWNFAEGNPFGASSGSWEVLLRNQSRDLNYALAQTSTSKYVGNVIQKDARYAEFKNVVVCTDPPYYDNVPYSDLADFFYVWLRRSLKEIYPNSFNTVLTPKTDELVADHVRWGGKDKAEEFFEQGFFDVFKKIRVESNPDFPIAVFYAFRQTEKNADGLASTGWETMLSGLLNAGYAIQATWPVRTEMASRVRGQDSNALASSIVLVLRPREISAEAASRRTFLQTLKAELPIALRDLQQGSIAPVDLAQATIGPGMAIFSRFTQVNEADGSNLTVRTALALINQVLDEILGEQEGDFDSETRFCIKWFSQFGWEEGLAGESDVLARALNTSVAALERGGIFKANAGKARLIHPREMSSGWDPGLDKAISVWEVAVRLAETLQTHGAQQAAELSNAASKRVEMDSVRELSYLLYSIAEKKRWADAAILFNGLGTSWSELASIKISEQKTISTQETLDL